MGGKSPFNLRALAAPVLVPLVRLDVHSVEIYREARKGYQLVPCPEMPMRGRQRRNGREDGRVRS